VQAAIVIHDVTLALLEVIQLGIARAAISGLAMRFQVVALNANSIARLRIRTCRPVSLIAPRITYSSDSSHALEIAIVVDDLTFAFPVIVELGMVPIAVYGLATCFQIIAMAFDVLACLGIRAGEAASRWNIATLIASDRRARSAVNAGDAAQLAVVIYDFAAAFVVIVKLGIFPVAICRGAASLQIVAVSAHVLARLRIRPARKSRRNAAASAAPQSAIVVNNVATAALDIAQLSALPAAG